MSVLETFKCRTYQVQADSPSIRLTFIDGEVIVVNRNTFLDVDVLSPDSTQAGTRISGSWFKHGMKSKYDLK